jgi:hypothetical protein
MLTDGFRLFSQLFQVNNSILPQTRPRPPSRISKYSHGIRNINLFNILGYARSVKNAVE